MIKIITTIEHRKIENQNYSAWNFKILNDNTEESGFIIDGTIYRAGLKSIYKALLYCKKNYNNNKIEIHTSSKYAIDCLTKWNKNWINNGWLNAKKQSIANKALIIKCLNLLNNLSCKLIYDNNNVDINIELEKDFKNAIEFVNQIN